MSRCLENVLRLFYIILSTKWMAHLHLCIVQHLLLKVIDLALLVVRLAFHGSQGAVVFVTRADCHVVETVV